MKPVSKFSFIFQYHMRRLSIRTDVKAVKEINLVNRSHQKIEVLRSIIWQENVTISVLHYTTEVYNQITEFCGVLI